MAITDEQRSRAEANRLAALARRKALVESFNGQQHRSSTLFKCPNLPHEPAPNPNPNPIPNLVHSNGEPIRFRVRLEICSPDSFAVTPIALRGFTYPGQEDCLRRLNECLSSVSVFF